MASMKTIAYKLFDQGFDSKSAEVKQVVRNRSTRDTYFAMWKLKEVDPDTPDTPDILDTPDVSTKSQKKRGPGTKTKNKQLVDVADLLLDDDDSDDGNGRKKEDVPPIAPPVQKKQRGGGGAAPVRSTAHVGEAAFVHVHPKSFTMSSSLLWPAMSAAINEWNWPPDIDAGEFLDRYLYTSFKQRGITLSGYIVDRKNGSQNNGDDGGEYDDNGREGGVW